MQATVKWSAYERKVRKAFDDFIYEVKVGDKVSIYHGNELMFNKIKVLGFEKKNFDLGGSVGSSPTMHLIYQPQYGERTEQPIDREGSKTPWFDGPFIIHRDFRFEAQ